LGLLPVTQNIPQLAGEKKAGSGRNPLHVKDIAKLFLADPVNGGGQSFFRNFHVMKIGVKDFFRAGHDADMTFPEHQITAAQCCLRGRATQRRHLLIAISWTGDIRRMERNLNKTGTIETSR
jgi:hypothetical protein